MKKILLFFTLILVSSVIYSQCNGRYESEIFNTVSSTTVNYSDTYNDERHQMDIYTADNDTEMNRPVILFIHGGGFLNGDKNLTYAVDFCESFAKRGYVTVSMNYRLTNPFSLFPNRDHQYETILKAVYDAKAAVRYLRKDFENGDNYGIDTSAIFIGGYSAGAITSLHLSYIDDIIELPNSVVDNDGSYFNPQSIASSIGGNKGFEGDAGNYGYSSKVSGVFSYAGALFQPDFIDGDDVPLATVHGTNDSTVFYDCGPGFGSSYVVELCGSGELQAQASLEEIIHDELILEGVDHGWTENGIQNVYYLQALNFTSEFLFPLLPCNNLPMDINQNLSNSTKDRKLDKVVDLLGQEFNPKPNNLFIEIYDDGSFEKKMFFEKF